MHHGRRTHEAGADEKAEEEEEIASDTALRHQEKFLSAFVGHHKKI